VAAEKGTDAKVFSEKFKKKKSEKTLGTSALRVSDKSSRLVCVKNI